MNKINFEPNLIRVCIDKQSSILTKGRAYSPTTTNEIVFHDWAKLLIEIDNLLDRNGYPQAFQNKRSFKEEKTSFSYHYKPKIEVDESWFLSQVGECMTYNILIRTRQFTGWQGDLFDENGWHLGHFSNDLQLLRLVLKDVL